MILETIPEIQKLTNQEKLQLANELWEELENQADSVIDPAIIELLESRMAEYRRNPSSARSYEEVKKDILGN